MCYLIFDEMSYSVLTHHQHICICVVLRTILSNVNSYFSAKENDYLERLSSFFFTVDLKDRSLDLMKSDYCIEIF